VKFASTISAGQQLQAYALDRAAIGTGFFVLLEVNVGPQPVKLTFLVL